MLSPFDNKRARVESRIALKLSGEEPLIFTGVLRGTIVAPRGNNDFLWDPIFQPDGYQETYAEMNAKEKNLISDRGNAVRSMLTYLQSTQKIRI